MRTIEAETVKETMVITRNEPTPVATVPNCLCSIWQFFLSVPPERAKAPGDG